MVLVLMVAAEVTGCVGEDHGEQMVGVHRPESIVGNVTLAMTPARLCISSLMNDAVTVLPVTNVRELMMPNKVKDMEASLNKKRSGVPDPSAVSNLVKVNTVQHHTGAANDHEHRWLLK
jgi:hypothetical protein